MTRVCLCILALLQHCLGCSSCCYSELAKVYCSCTVDVEYNKCWFQGLTIFVVWSDERSTSSLNLVTVSFRIMCSCTSYYPRDAGVLLSWLHMVSFLVGPLSHLLYSLLVVDGNLCFTRRFWLELSPNLGLLKGAIHTTLTPGTCELICRGSNVSAAQAQAVLVLQGNRLSLMPWILPVARPQSRLCCFAKFAALQHPDSPLSAC